MANQFIHQEYLVAGNNFNSAGSASEAVKSTLKKMGVASSDIRRVAIAMYEAEINMVIHADGGTIDVEVTPQEIRIVFKDRGPGIPDIEKAMQEGFSTAPHEVRELGFGAGMGLPNMKKNTDSLEIFSTIGVGTKIVMRVNF